MEGIGVEVSQKVKSAIKAKLVELGVYVDEELPDYIMVMVANNRSKSEMIEDLQLFLGTHTEKFISWLLQVLQKLQEVTLASLDARKASSSGTEKDKMAKKRKLPAADAEAESTKKDRKKKADVAKKDTSGKKSKKGLKGKSTKLEMVRVSERRPEEATTKEKKEAVGKPKDKASSSSGAKSIPLNLPTTMRSNPKPVLMVSDEDDEDFINIRADAEADLLVSELQEDVRSTPQRQLTLAPVAKSSVSASQRAADKIYSNGQQSSSVIPIQEVVKESVVLAHKDVRLQHIDEGGTSVKEARVTGSWHRPEPQATAASSSTYSPSRAMVKTSEQLTTKIPSVKRTPAIPVSEDGPRHSLASSLHQVDQTGSKYSEGTHIQPSSRITPVSHVGTIKSRLGKRPGEREELQMTSGTGRAVGVPSVVRVKGRPKLPLAAQANKNLILKAVAEAQKSVASAPIRVEPHLRNPGLLTRKNRENSSKIAVTLPNPRVTSNYDQEGWSLQDEVTNARAFENKPKLMVQLFQGQSTPVQSHQQPSAQTITAVVKNQAQTIQSQELLIQTQRLLVQTQAELIPTQPQPIASQPQVIQSQPELHQNAPQPDLVASLHEGMSSQSSMASANGNLAEDILMNESNGLISLSQPRSLKNPVSSDIEGQRPLGVVGGSQHSNHEVGRTQGHLPYSEGNGVMCPTTIIRSVPEEAPIGVVERQVVQTAKESPADTRASSPQFFVTLSGYDPCSTSGAGRVVRGDLGAKTRCFLFSDDMDMEEEECLDEGIGEEDSKDAIEGMEDGGIVHGSTVDKKGTHSTGPIVFRNITSNTPDDPESSMKTKNSERCRFWPACRLGERCEYHHPSIPCKAFPGCKFGDKCLYIHPNCKFDAACTRKDCPYTHALPRSLVAAPVAAPARFPLRPAAIQCRFYPKCTNVNCKFYHPKPCRFGNACNKFDCPYMHDREPIPSKEKLKWVCPAKA